MAASQTAIFNSISNIIMQLSKIKDIDSAYETLSNLVKNMISIEKEYFFNSKDNKIFEIYNEEVSDELLDLVKWSYSNPDISIFPEEKGSHIIMPITHNNEVIFIYCVFTLEEDFSNQFTLLLRIISFLMANLFENLMLLEEVTAKNYQIEKNKNFLNSILNSSNESIVVHSKDFNIQFKNDNFNNIIENPEIKLKIEELLNISFASKENQSLEIEVDNKNYSIDTTLFNFENEYFVISNIRDISGTKELEKLKKLDKMKMEFLSMISHELRTPLSAIKAYSETIVDQIEMFDGETLKDFMQVIYKESIHLEKLLNDLLDFSRLELKSLKLDKENFNINSLIAEVIKGLEESAKAKNIELKTNNLENDINVLMDKTRIRQVLLNLIQNAIKYYDETQEEPFVSINLINKDDENIIIEIKDNGIGIDEKHHKKIFEKFYRVDTSLTYKVQGTGIGLSLVKELVEIHKGNIEIKSEVGVGTEFIITLPKGVDQ